MPVVEKKQGVPARAESKAPRFDNALMNPGKYEVTVNSTFVLNFPLKQRKDGWWEIVSAKESEVVENVVMRMWNYDEMVEIRKMATTYDQSRRVHMIDHDVLNRLKIQRLMVSWTFGKDNPRLGLHHINGVLSDESWLAVSRIQTNILRNLIDRMNEQYEFVG